MKDILRNYLRTVLDVDCTASDPENDMAGGYGPLRFR